MAYGSTVTQLNRYSAVSSGYHSSAQSSTRLDSARLTAQQFSTLWLQHLTPHVTLGTQLRSTRLAVLQYAALGVQLGSIQLAVSQLSGTQLLARSLFGSSTYAYAAAYASCVRHAVCLLALITHLQS